MGLIVRVRRDANTIARLNVEPNAVALFEHHRSWPNLHLHFVDLICRKPLPPQMPMVRSIWTRQVEVELTLRNSESAICHRQPPAMVPDLPLNLPALSI